MNFFEQELGRILRNTHYAKDTTYVGRNAYLQLGGQGQARLFFNTMGTHNHFKALQISVIDKNSGKIDGATLRFSETLGNKRVGNPNFRNGIVPYVWISGFGKEEPEWYIYQLTNADYRLLGKEIEKYADLYLEQEQTAGTALEQTMT